jgi:tetratricopeptide (TPR) repeat protein
VPGPHAEPLTDAGRPDDDATAGDAPPPGFEHDTAHPSPLLERDDVLAHLHGSLARAIDKRSPVVVTLGGEPGSGRTSIARWFAGEAADRAWAVELACRRPDASGATWPFAPMIRVLLGIDAATDRDGIEHRVRDLVGDDPAGRAASIAAYLHEDPGSAPPDELPAAIADVVSATVLRRPLVVIVDDADRAPASARAAFDRVVSSIAGPLLVVLIARGPADVAVDPLSESASAELVERLLSRPNLPPNATSAIVAACRGLPLAVEHLVAMLADDGHLRWEYGRWTPAVDLASLPLPADLPSLVARRIGGLSAEERRVAAVATAGAETFDVSAIAAVLDADTDATRRIATALAERGIFRRLDDDRFAFGHDLIADVAATYADREAASAMHVSAADDLSAEGPVGPDVDEAIGAHLERAFRLAAIDRDREPTGRRAAEHLVRAARGAADARDEDAALVLLRRAASVLPWQDSGRARLLLDSAAMLAARGERRPGERLLGDAIRAARAAGDRLLELRATVAHARMLATASRIEEQIESLRDAADAAIAAGTAREDETTAAAGWSARGWVHVVRGHFAGAADAFAHAAAASAAAGLRREELAALRDLAATTVDGPAPVEEAVERARWIVDRVRGTAAEPGVSATLAVLLARAGRIDEARAVLDGIADAPAEESEAAAIASRAALVELHAGTVERAQSWLRAALALDLAEADRGVVQAWLAYAQTVGGDVEEAVDAADAAASLADTDDVIAQVTWHAAKARCLAALGRAGEARALVRLALRLADQTDLSELRARTRLDFADVLLASGRANEAGPAAGAALRALERKGSVGETARARSILDRVAGRPAAEASETADDRSSKVGDPSSKAEAGTPGGNPSSATADAGDETAARNDAWASGELSRQETEPAPNADASSNRHAPSDGEPSDAEGSGGPEGKRERRWFW